MLGGQRLNTTRVTKGEGMVRHFWAPGRVNLIGDHTDYSGGLVLPAAIDRGLTLTVEAAQRITLTSSDHEGVADMAPDGSGGTPDGWGRYVAAVAAELHALGRPPVGVTGSLTSDLPAGSGLSSSAALEVGVAPAVCAGADFALDPMALAQAGPRAEQAAVGVACGVLDQAASIRGRADSAVLLDCTTLETRLVPLAADLAIVVVDSGVTRQLEASGYGRRRAELEEGAARLGRPLADLTPGDLGDVPDDVGGRRVRHVVTENARVRAAVDALAADDRAAVGELFAASHASLRDDYEVTVAETDLLVELLGKAGAVAARMTGGGFGGSVVALVAADRADAVAEEVVAAYGRAQHRATATAYRCQAADGAAEVGRSDEGEEPQQQGSH